MDEPSDRLRAARQRTGLAGPREAALRFGWSESTYRGHENGSRGIKLKSAQTYAAAFGVQAGWIMTGDSPPPWYGNQLQQIRARPARQIPLVELNNLVLIQRGVHWGGGSVSIPDASDLGVNLACVDVHDDSMAGKKAGEPSISIGDQLVVDLEPKLSPGCIVIAEVEGEAEPLVRRYQERGKTAQGILIYDLTPLNPDYATIRIDDPSKARIIARVVRHIRRL